MSGPPAAGPLAFTCLLPVHPNAEPGLFRAAAASIAGNSLAPTEVLVCPDGPLPTRLRMAIADSGFRLLDHADRRGLHHALNQGLAWVRTPWVCRADGDDINRPDRFARQVAYLLEHPEVDVLGGAIEEHAEGGARRTKRAPTTHEAVVARARWRNPMHHMTVFFRRDAALEVGGYPAISRKEDYAFWLRLIGAGFRFANLPQVVVEARCHGLARRRSGLHNLASERALWRLRRDGPRAIARGATAAHAMRATVLVMPPIAALAYASLRCG